MEQVFALMVAIKTRVDEALQVNSTLAFTLGKTVIGRTGLMSGTPFKITVLFEYDNIILTEIAEVLAGDFQINDPLMKMINDYCDSIIGELQIKLDEIKT